MGKEPSFDENEETELEAQLSSSKTRALKILASRDLSTNYMRQRLMQKGVSPETAQQTVQWLLEIGYLNDSEHASNIVKHYSAKGYGIARIKDELFKRGIVREMWDEALESASDMIEAAYNYAALKLNGSRDEDDLRKVSNALYRRGFTYDESREAMRRYLEETGASET